MLTLKRILFSALLGSSLQAVAVEFINTNEYITAPGTEITTEQWILTDVAEVGGTYRNDLFILSGKPLNLTGTFEGNLWGVGRLYKTTLTGTCRRNVRLVGNAVEVQGTIDGNLSAAYGTLAVGTNAVVKGDVAFMGASAVIEGPVGGKLKITAADTVTLDGPVAGDADITAPEILLGPQARISGSLTYTSGNEIIPSADMVAGELIRRTPEQPPLFSTAKLYSQLLGFLAAFLAGVPFIVLFPMTTAMASQLIRRSPWKCLLVGLLASGALPIFGLMCFSSIIGIPLGVLLLAVWGMLGYLSRIIAGLVLGALLLRSLGNSVGRILGAMALGLAVIYLAALLPGMTLMIWLLVIWFGMGALILALLEKRRLIIQVPQSLKEIETLKHEPTNPEENSP